MSVNGKMKREKRTEILDKFRERSEDIQVLSNVNVLKEGIDIPRLDAIMFMDPK